MTKRSIPKQFARSNQEEQGGLLYAVKIQNLSNAGFYIQKAEVEVINGESKESFIASIKYLLPDTFLISLRGKSGIEAARIYITGDTVLINDRINRQLLYGRPEIFTKRFGIGIKMLPVLLGDFIEENSLNEEKIICNENVFELNRIIHGIKMQYVIDCKRNKIISSTREGSLNNSNTSIGYENFIMNHGHYYASQIHLIYKELNINIKIEKIESPWDGNIEFIPGNRYELIELL